MGVQGYLSLYTILLGWKVYDGLWDIITQLGLILLPFAFIAIRSFLNPFLSMGAKDAGTIGARRFVLSIFGALFILINAGAPMVKLSPHILHYQPLCSKSGKIATPGNTGTTYDSILPVPDNIKVPLYWYFVLAVSNGLTNQAMQIISCQPVDLRSLQNELNLTTIQDTNLKAETVRFYNECYLPAYNKFVENSDKQVQQSTIDAALKKYGQDDIGWIGSMTFQVVPGFYDAYYASKPVVGFAYDSNNPHDQIDGQVNTPKWSAPLCLNWWNMPSVGLREKLYNQFSNNLKAELGQIDYHFQGDEILTQDAAIRAVLEKSTGGGFINKGYSSEEDSRTGVNNFYGKWIGKAYIDKLAAEEYPKIHILVNMLPIIQAVLLFVVIMLLALALPMSGYSIGFCATATVFLFSITFCSFLWHAITWFDQFLLQAMYGATDIGKYNDPVRLVYNLTENALNPEKNLVDITISIMYVVVPFIWMGVTGWAGIAVGQAMHGLTDIKDASGTVGKQGATGAGKMISKITK
jgi:hypothetical protein